MPVYLSRNEDGELTNHLVMAKTKSEEKAGTIMKSPKKKPNNSASIQEYPFNFYEKNTNKKSSLEGKFKPKLKTITDIYFLVYNIAKICFGASR